MRGAGLRPRLVVPSLVPWPVGKCTCAPRPGKTTNPGASCAKEHQYSVRPPLARFSGARSGAQSLTLKRLSATDISALASMKNVAKCDTWCELQNPVNHRVFERKLRPKPSGRGHVCLGVTHRVSPNPPRVGPGGGGWLPVPHRARLA